ncbi:hypothetical protein HIM_00839 [Hirsutella minnesotensis 3608]|nr:hypothetical protein HIM_00839 [Hirsutella minnesotensis 3608]
MGPGTENRLFDKLKETGLIETKAFGLAAADNSGKSGAVTFGGLDTKKFYGRLQKTPLLLDGNGQLDEFVYPLTPHGTESQRANDWLPVFSYKVDVANISTKHKDGSVNLFGGKASDKPIPVTLDMGSTVSIVPKNVHAEILRAFPDAKPAAQRGFPYAVDCARQKEDASVDFTISGTTIKVPYSQFIIEIGGSCYLSVIESRTSKCVPLADGASPGPAAPAPQPESDPGTPGTDGTDLIEPI